MSSDIKIYKNYDLSSLNCFGLKSEAEVLVEIHGLDGIPTLINSNLDLRKIHFLGGGSNLILPEKIQGLVIRPMIMGHRIVKEDPEHYFVAVGAGENWHQFVLWCLEHSFFGLENLALIPGHVGAAPIQNIGAYGVEVKEFIEKVLLYDFDKQTFEEINNSDCKFGYRHSIFKEPAYFRKMICSVVFKLNKVDLPKFEYKDLKAELGDIKSKVPAIEVCKAVIKVRTKKLPDPKLIGNVGSFFKNPIVSKALHDQIQNQFPNLVSYAQANSDYKLAAAWLIDQCGFKGQVKGQVKMHEAQALVMVNLGKATKSEVLILQQEIQKQVHKKFGVQLDPEPVFW